jgi:predicted lipid-binding transport protein (Tim44 family)
MLRHLPLRTLGLALATAAMLAAGAGPADARAGSGFSFGSRGARTISAPPPTATAPRSVAPIERSMTQPGPSFGQGSLAQTAGATRPASRFGWGLAGGLLGAGLLGALFGSGFFGGLGGLASIFGMLIQFALIGGLVWFALRLFRGRPQAAFAGPGGGFQRDAPARPGDFGGSLPPRVAGGASPGAPLAVGKADFDTFERSLVAVQDAYGREDLDTLRRLVTPEMASYFAGEIADNARKGVVNRVSAATLLQGDLAEAWRENGADYASVAMRFSLLDHVEDRATGRLVSGSPTEAMQATEVWTFTRGAGGPWLLGAIQQAG